MENPVLEAFLGFAGTTQHMEFVADHLPNGITAGP